MDTPCAPPTSPTLGSRTHTTQSNCVIRRLYHHSIIISTFYPPLAVIICNMSLRPAERSKHPASSRLDHVLGVGCSLLGLGDDPAGGEGEFKRFVIVAMGPTGSGKTRLADEAARVLKIDEACPLERVMVDDLVESNPVYRRNVLEILLFYRRGKTEEQFKGLMTNPSHELYAAFDNAYYTARGEKSCMEVLHEGDCNDANDTRLAVAITQKKNIVLEMTGEYSLKWIGRFVNERRMSGVTYEIVYAYNLVTFDRLVERNKTRAYTAAIKFLEDPEHRNAPRLPNVADDPNGVFLRKVIAIRQGIINNAKNATTVGMDRMILFDNNCSDLRLLLNADAEEAKRTWKSICLSVEMAMKTPDEPLCNRRLYHQ